MSKSVLRQLTSRRIDFEEHVAELQFDAQRGYTDRGPRAEAFDHAVRLIDPIAVETLEAFDKALLNDCGSVDRAIDTDGGLEWRWTLSWPQQRVAKSRRDGAPISPITVRAFFPDGWTHGHLGGLVVSAWPFRVLNEEDARRQQPILWAIAESEYHDRIFDSVDNWRIAPSRGEVS